MKIEPMKSALKIREITSNSNFLGIELPSINSLKSLTQAIKICGKYDIPLSQANEVLGASLIPQTEIKEMLSLAQEEKVGLTFSITSRPEYDTDTAFYRTTWGREQGRRLNSLEKIEVSVEEVHKLISFGCSGIIIYDLGLLKILNTLKAQGEIPESFIIKISSHCGITNALTAQAYVENGANDIIPTHDLSLTSLLEIRKSIPTTPLSIIIDTYMTKGGFIRIHDLTKIVDSLSPVFIKMGNSVQTDPYNENINLEERIRRIRAIIDILPNDIHSYNIIKNDSPYKAIPISIE